MDSTEIRTNFQHHSLEPKATKSQRRQFSYILKISAVKEVIEMNLLDELAKRMVDERQEMHLHVRQPA